MILIIVIFKIVINQKTILWNQIWLYLSKMIIVTSSIVNRLLWQQFVPNSKNNFIWK